MKKLFTLLAALAFAVPALAQINAEDSSVQVITYWDKNEKHTYNFKFEKANVKGADTTVTESIKYKVDIAVLDSTATSYTISWKYRDFEVKMPNALLDKIAKLNDGVELKFTTDENGTFLSLLNWQEVKDKNEKALKMLENSEGSKSVQLSKISAGLRQKYSSKEAIEAHSIKDILQFHDFFGIGLKLGEPIKEKLTDPVPFTKEAIVSDISVELVEIDLENASYLLKLEQSFDKKSVRLFMNELFREIYEQDELDAIEIITLEDIRAANMHETGWPLDMYYGRVMTVDDRIQLESREIYFEE